MLIRNSGDILKARSNHWFFAYIPQWPAQQQPQEATAAAPMRSLPVATNIGHGYYRYLTFAAFGLLALYTQIAVVYPTHTAWTDVTLEAFGFQHVMARSRHERLARKFHLKAQFDILHGVKARTKASREEREGLGASRNATSMFSLAQKNAEEAQRENQEAEALGNQASEEHMLYLEYLNNASLHEERAEALKEQADNLGNQSEHYRHIAAMFSLMVQQDQELEEAYLRNATWEGEISNNMSLAEQDREDHMWVCRWSWSRKYVCGVLGGASALGEAQEWHEKETEDYQKAMDLQQQVLQEQAKAMIAATKAARLEEETRLDRLEAEELQNATIVEEVKAAEERAKELRDLQSQLEDLESAHEHLQKFKHYQALEVQLNQESQEEDDASHAQWALGTKLLDKAEEEQGKSDREWELAKAEEERQHELVERANMLGRRLRLYAAVAVACALISLAFFIVALVTTNTVSLGYQLRKIAVAVSVTLERQWEGRNTYWEGRSILGDHQDRNCLHQLSCWFHHGLCFLVVAAIQGARLSTIFEHESWQMRGDILCQFALTSGCLEALLFQAGPHAAVLLLMTGSLTREYFRNVTVRLLSSTIRFALQILLLLILSGQDSTWLFVWIQSLHRVYIPWIMLLLATSWAHMWFIEYPHVLTLARNHGAALSAVTFTTYGDITVDKTSQCSKKSPLNAAKGGMDEECANPGTVAVLSQRNDANNETDSLLTVSRAEAPGGISMVSLPYSTISLPSALTPDSAANPMSTPSPALQRLYEVSIQDEFFVILPYIELMLLVGNLLVICASWPELTRR